jgi:hypothetical protein
MAGGIAGIVGAVSMSAVAMAGSAIVGKHWYGPLELVGGLATGSPARFTEGLQPGIALAGALLHFALGAGWGVLFGILVGYLMHDVLPKEGVWVGAFFGIIVWVIDLYAVAPRFDPAAARAIPLWFGALSHLGYGSMVGATFHYLRQRADHTTATPTLQHP